MKNSLILLLSTLLVVFCLSFFWKPKFEEPKITNTRIVVSSGDFNMDVEQVYLVSRDYMIRNNQKPPSIKQEMYIKFPGPGANVVQVLFHNNDGSAGLMVELEGESLKPISYRRITLGY